MLQASCRNVAAPVVLRFDLRRMDVFGFDLRQMGVFRFDLRLIDALCMRLAELFIPSGPWLVWSVA